MSFYCPTFLSQPSSPNLPLPTSLSRPPSPDLPLPTKQISYEQNKRAFYSVSWAYTYTISLSCIFILQLLKSVAERGKWTRLFMEAQKLYAAGDMESALMMYLLLSELGFEVAQSNAAYILDQGKMSILVLCYKHQSHKAMYWYQRSVDTHMSLDDHHTTVKSSHCRA